jgi:hypothetical protein
VDIDPAETGIKMVAIDTSQWSPFTRHPAFAPAAIFLGNRGESEMGRVKGEIGSRSGDVQLNEF